MINLSEGIFGGIVLIFYALYLFKSFFSTNESSACSNIILQEWHIKSTFAEYQKEGVSAFKYLFNKQNSF